MFMNEYKWDKGIRLWMVICFLIDISNMLFSVFWYLGCYQIELTKQNIPRTIQPRQPKRNLTLVSKVQAFINRMTQALSGCPLISNPAMYMSVPEPGIQNLQKKCN